MELEQGITFWIKPDTRPVWEKLGFKSEQAWRDSFHPIIFTADWETGWCYKCNCPIEECSLADKRPA